MDPLCGATDALSDATLDAGGVIVIPFQKLS
jgi:hypothetical protein